MDRRINFMKGTLRFKTGDATTPVSAGHRMIIHVCNDIGKFGAGFSGAISRRWGKVRNEYYRWYKTQHQFRLGNIQEVNVQSDTTIINMIAQKGVKKKTNKKDLMDYEALEECLNKVAKLAKEYGSSIHMPRIGCGLCGSSWNKIEPLINKILIEDGLNVTVYDFSE